MQNQSSYKCKVYVWTTNLNMREAGHAALALEVTNGNEKHYLSFWPKGSANRLSGVESALNATLEKDRLTEKRLEDGVYTSTVTEEQAKKIIDGIQEIKKKVENKELKYYLLNNPSELCYNCSGAVEHVLVKSGVVASEKFNPQENSNPLRVAFVLRKDDNFKKEKETEGLLQAIEKTFSPVHLSNL